MSEIHPENTVKILGYCQAVPQVILDRYQKADYDFFKNLAGEFIIVIEDPKKNTAIISSALGMCPYYYFWDGHELYHGESIIEIIRRSGLSWEWDWRALADLTFFEHTIGNDTLHPKISRVPAGTLLRFSGGQFSRQELKPEPVLSQKPSPDYALEVFNREMDKYSQGENIVSMSGGFDSRLILSRFLMRGEKPLLVTMGTEDSSDVTIARQIAAFFKLPVIWVDLHLNDYFDEGEHVAFLTNGTKTFQNWHTYLYPKNAKVDPKWNFFIGSNGEFCRSYYLNKGIAAQTASLFRGYALREYWKRRLLYLFTPQEISAMAKPWAEQYNPEHIHARIERMVTICGTKDIQQGLDECFTHQRVRNFAGNGIRLYAESVSWKAPFFSLEWMEIVRGLARRWKFGANWHRYALHKNFPKLMEFPESQTGRTIAKTAPFLYWSPLNKSRKVPLMNYKEQFKDNRVYDFFTSHEALLGELMDTQIARKIITEHRNGANRTMAVSFFLTVLFWLKVLKEHQKESRCSGK